MSDLRKERRLTPMRTLDLMREEDRRSAVARHLEQNHAACGLETVANALADHVKAALAPKRRRRAQ